MNKKITLFFSLLMTGSFFSFSQGSENFSNITGTAGAYSARSWTGTDGVTWTAFGRTDEAMTGLAITIRQQGNGFVQSPVYSGGMGVLTFSYQKKFTGDAQRQFQVYVNGTLQETVAFTSAAVQTFSKQLDISGNVQLRIVATGADAGDNRIGFDNISWTAYEAPVPVMLKSFSAAPKATITDLSWTTAKEENNKGFEIERSADSKTWSAIGFVASQTVNSVEEVKYAFTDKQPLSGANYYRLKQVDFDGAFEYSGVRKVNFGTDAKVYIIYPNPAQNSIKFEGLSGTETIKFFNALGNNVKTVNDATASIEVSDLAAGIYNVQIIEGNQVANQKLVIAK